MAQQPSMANNSLLGGNRVNQVMKDNLAHIQKVTFTDMEGEEFLEIRNLICASNLTENAIT
jgi:hypothetical protein